LKGGLENKERYFIKLLCLSSFSFEIYYIAAESSIGGDVQLNEAL